MKIKPGVYLNQKISTLIRKITATVAAGTMIITSLGFDGIAQPVSANENTDHLCEFHPVHTDCGFIQEQAEQPCQHKHEDSCYKLECKHEHQPECYSSESYEEADQCSHSHTEECYVLECSHTEHNEECGFAPAVSGSHCKWICPVHEFDQLPNAAKDDSIHIEYPENAVLNEAGQLDFKEDVSLVQNGQKNTTNRLEVYSAVADDPNYRWNGESAVAADQPVFHVTYVVYNPAGQIVQASGRTIRTAEARKVSSENKTDEEEEPDGPKEQDQESKSSDGQFMSDTTFSEVGGVYSLAYILQHYQFAIFGDVTLNTHCMGAPLVQGDLKGAGGSFSDAGWAAANVTPYVQGYVGLNRGANHRNEANPSKTLFVGSSNSVKSAGGSDYELNGIRNFNVNGKVLVNDNFINWSQLETAIQNESRALPSLSGSSFTKQDGKLLVKAGTSVTLSPSDLNGCWALDIVGNAADDVDTIINFTDTGSVTLPMVHVNGSQPTVSEVGNGSPIVWNLPYATTVKIPSMSYLGHVVAPNADISMDSGNYNGCIIGKSFVTAAEGHLYRYNGTALIPAEAQFQIRKTISGQTPGENQKFTFSLYRGELVNGLVVKAENGLIESAQNQNDLIQFKPIDYSEEGDFYYVVEEEKADGYLENTQKIYIRVRVSANEQKPASFNQTISYFDSSDLSSELTSPEFVNEVEEGEYTHAVALKGSKSIVQNLGNGNQLNHNDWLKNQKFSFGLFDEQDNLIQSAESDENGDFSFADLTFTSKDIGKKFIYTVRELAHTHPGYETNDQEYTVTVDVSPLGTAGDFEFIVSDNAKSLVFTNEYSTSGKLALSALKSLDYGALTSQEFTFELLDENRNLIESVVNSGSDINFTPISLTSADTGSKIFYIREAANPSDSSYVYDQREFKAVADITYDEQGNLISSVAYFDENGEQLNSLPEFINKVKAETSLNLNVQKQLKYSDLKADEFTFRLSRLDPESEKYEVIETKTNDEDGNVPFSSLKYTQEDIGKTYHYQVAEEINILDPSITAETAPISFSVEVQMGEDGELKLIRSQNTEQLTFTNTYTEDGTVQINASKQLLGADLNGSDFSFILEQQSGDQFIQVGNPVTNGENGQIRFPEIQYKKSDAGKVYFYRIREVNDKKPGFEYDSKTIMVEVKVDLDQNQQIQTEVTYTSDDYVFINKYEAAGEISLKANKRLLENGQETNLEDGQFSFSIVDKKTGEVVSTGKNDQNGNIQFDPIRFVKNEEKDETGSYIFSVSEDGLESPIPGMVQDTSVIDIDVDVTDNGDGTLEVTASQNAQSIEFTNQIVHNSMVLAASKNFTNGELKPGAFNFNLYEIDENGQENLKSNTKNDQNGQIMFDPIYYTHEDHGKTFNYVIREEKNEEANPNVHFTASEQYVDVAVKKVTDENGKHFLLAEANYKDPSGTAGFTNVYRPEEASIIFDGIKTLTGMELKENQFSFELSEVFDDGSENILETVRNGADGTFAFSPLVYQSVSDIGKHTYKIREIQGSGTEGISYDPREYTIEVIVLNNPDDGRLELEFSEDALHVEFENTYSAEGSIVLSATKQLIGADLKAGQFKFSLTDEEGKVVDTASNDVNGAVSFKELKYTQADAGKTFTYYIQEVVPDKPEPGFTYDESSSYEVRVKVNDSGNGKLTADVDYLGNQPVFTNIYQAVGSIQFKGTKVLENRNLKDKEFRFELLQDDMVLQTVSNDKDGNIVFDPIEYHQGEDGVYHYQIREAADPVPGVTVDSTVYEYTVTVTDNGQGVMQTVSSQNPQAFVFTNEYHAGGTASVQAAKVLEGKDLNKDEFSFVLKDEDGNILQTKSNEADGKVQFDDIQYSEADAGKTFTYTVEEVLPENPKPGIEYDSHVETVRIHVEDGEDGKLVTTVYYSQDGAVFTNRYSAKGQISFTGTKILENSILKADQFSFMLIEDDNVLQTVANDENGLIAFDPIEYTLEDIGIHTYSVIEGTDSLPGVTNDPAVKTIEVNVEDNGDGTLKISAEESDLNFEFINRYQANGEAQIQASKILTGRKLEAGQFEFELIDQDGTVLETASNAEDGSVIFTPIQYQVEDAGKTFTYQIREKSQNKPGYVYDQSVKTVIVEVTDEHDGTLQTQVSYKNDDHVFKNEYQANGEIQFKGYKKLENKKLVKGQFAFDILENGKVISRTANQANGQIVFEPIVYSEKDTGVHEYEVREKVTDQKGIIFDQTVYKIRVTVADQGNGILTAKSEDSFKKLNFVNRYQPGDSQKPQKPKPVGTAGDTGLLSTLSTFVLSIVLMFVTSALLLKKRKKC